MATQVQEKRRRMKQAKKRKRSTSTSKLTAEQRGIKEGYRSGLEETLALDLKARGVSYHFEPYKISYLQPEKIRTYLPDFLLSNGIIIETKGRFITADRQKHLLIQKQQPQLDIRFVFQNPNTKINKGSTTTYAMWCIKNGFKYAKKLVPEEWLNERSS